MTLTMELRGSLVKNVREDDGGLYLVLEVLNTIDGRVARLLRTEPLPIEEAGPIPVEDLDATHLDLIEPWHAVCKLVLHEMRRPWTSSPVTAFSCRTDFKPYQFRPLLKFFGDAARRVLIADETGLGKTIEAGYIIVEDIVRHGHSRVVILCPPRLRLKWKSEMTGKFGLPFRIVSGRGLVRALENDDDGFLLIASMDCGRSIDSETLEETLKDGSIDLLVIDEIHRMIGRGGETLRRGLGLALAHASRGVIGLSATPLQIEIHDLKRVMDIVTPGELDIEAFDDEMELTASVNRIGRALGSLTWNDEQKELIDRESESIEKKAESLPNENVSQVRILLNRIRAPENLDDPVIRRELRECSRDVTNLSRHLNRSRAIEVQEDRKRIVATIGIELSEETRKGSQNGAKISVSELSLYSLMDDFLKEEFSYVHRLQLSSCLPAMANLMRSGMTGSRTWQAWERDDPNLSDCEDGGGLHEEARKTCRDFASRFGLLPRDSKWESLRELLVDLKTSGKARKAIVFTHWIPTHQYLIRRASLFREVRFFHVKPGSEDDRIEGILGRFAQQEGFACLLATDMLREGLDLDAADCVINYDLPYNPQAIEQRIGRVDRVGQVSDEIRVYNMYVKGSVDEGILKRILERIGIFQRAMGDMRPITTEMMRSLDEEGVIDDKEVVKTAMLLAERHRLMNHDAFSGVESVLDDEVKDAHAIRVNDMRGLYWTVLKRFFELVAPQSTIEWNAEQRSLEVKGLASLTHSAIEMLVGHGNRTMVRSVLHESEPEDGITSIRLDGGRDSVSLTHPLVQIACNVVSKSYGEDKKDTADWPIWFLAEEAFKQLNQNLNSLALVDYSFMGTEIRHREWKWWGEGQDCEILPLDEIDTAHVLSLSMNTRPLADHERSEGLVRDIERAVKSDLGNWGMNQAKRELRIRELSLKAELRSIASWLRRLRRIEEEGPFSEELTKKMGVLKRREEGICNQLEEQKGTKAFNCTKDMANAQIAAIIVRK